MKYINKNVLSVITLTTFLSLPIQASESDYEISVESLWSKLTSLLASKDNKSSAGTVEKGGITASSGGYKGDP